MTADLAIVMSVLFIWPGLYAPFGRANPGRFIPGGNPGAPPPRGAPPPAAGPPSAAPPPRPGGAPPGGGAAPAAGGASAGGAAAAAGAPAPRPPAAAPGAPAPRPPLPPPPRPVGSGSRVSCLPCASIVTAYDARSPSEIETYTPFIPPSGVFSARSNTPALQPALHVTFENTATSWNDLLSTSHPPSGDRGVPMISPFWARQSAWPRGVHPVSADPLNRKSGRNVGPAA